MCFTFSAVVGSSRRSETTTTSYDSSISSNSTIDSKLDAEFAPSSAEWISNSPTSRSPSRHDAAQQAEGQLTLSETEYDLMLDAHQAVVDRRPRNRLSRQQGRHVDTAQRRSPLRQVQSPTDVEMDRQYQEEHTNRRPHGWVKHSKGACVSLSPLISIAPSTKQAELVKESFYHSPPRAQHGSWMDKNPQLAAEFQKIQPTTKTHMDICPPTRYIDNKKPTAIRKETYPLHKTTPSSPTQSSSSSSSSTQSTTSTEATDPPSPEHPTMTTSLPFPPQNNQPQPPTPTCPTFATTFNNMVIHHLRTHWPQPHGPLDIPTREEVLSLIYARLKRLPTSVGRERVSIHDSEEEFIERRALVVAQGVRRDLVREMERVVGREEREFRNAAEAELRFADGGR